MTCIEVRGIWDITVDRDPANPGTSVCREVWSIGQDGCTIAVASDPASCSPCFLASPLCWGAAGSAPGDSSFLWLRWSFTNGGCTYDAELQATVDGATLTGTIWLEQQWVPGGICTGYVRFFDVTGTRRLAG